MDTTTTTFGMRLREQRTKCDLTIRELGEKAGISFQAVSRMENGHYDPSWGVAIRLADALGVSLDLLADRVIRR